MPMKVNELNPLQEKIMQILMKNTYLAYSSREIAEYLSIAHSTARKHLKELFDKRELQRGKQKDYNKTFFYYVG